MSDDRKRDDETQTLTDWLGFTDAPRWWVARPLGIIVSVGMILVSVVLFGLALVAAVNLLLTSLGEGDGVGGAGLGTGGLIVALLGAPFLIWSTVLKHQTLRYQKEGHITDRINKAVEQLGAEKTVKVPSAEGDKSIERSEPNIEVRIGAILSLERIAQDSTKYDKGRDHVRVMEILCAYVRHNAPRQKDETSDNAPPPRLDIQKALDVVKRRGRVGRDIEAKEKYRLDLRETDLRGYDLSRGDFVGAVFWNTNLKGVSFKQSNLTATQFESAEMDYVFLAEATLQGTSLRNVNLNEDFITGIGTAALKSVFIDGANMPLYYVDPSNAWRVFGASDTIVSNDMAASVKAGILLSEFRRSQTEIKTFKSYLTMRGEDTNYLESDAETYVHWSTYSATDFLTYTPRQAFKQKHNLIGWPFDD